jgi:NAD(P)-dependent dehydrogenase (short-subunit alcohol dehydrogenase family)
VTQAEPNALAGKVAIVTGGNRGIGRAIARKLAADGARVMIAARDAARLADTVQEIVQAGGVARSLSIDLRRAEAAAAVVDATLDAFGSIDLLVNNAGATKRGDFLALTDADWEDGFALKFFNTVRLTRACWPHLQARAGSVVIISGIGGHTPGIEFSLGGSVNAALLALTKSLAERGIKDGVRVNAILPGFIRSERWLSRVRTHALANSIGEDEASARILAESNTVGLGEPEDVANLVAYIVSPQGRFLQGALIDLDGGQTKSV